MFGDGAFDAKPMLNTIASKGYIPIVRRGLASPGGYGARIRDRAYNESLYAYRSVGEGIFGASTVEFGDRIKTKKKESTRTRILTRILIYCLKIIVRWLIDKLNTPYPRFSFKKLCGLILLVWVSLLVFSCFPSS